MTMNQTKLSKQTIFEDEYASLWYYPDIKIIHHKFHKFIYGDHFRTLLTKGADVFEQEGCIKWLSDDRNNSALPSEDAKWAIGNWNPRVLGAGWRYWAMILPDKSVGKLNMKRLITNYEMIGVQVELFEDTDSALDWLMCVD